jgi:hypothetical protein
MNDFKLIQLETMEEVRKYIQDDEGRCIQQGGNYGKI